MTKKTDVGEEFPDLSLDNLNDGAASEYFAALMEKVKENILDPNTSWKSKRELTLKVTFKPNEERDRATVAIVPSCKLAPIVGHEGRIALGFDMGVLKARAIPATAQETLPFTLKAVEKKAVNS